MDLIEANKARLQEKPDLYRKRQAIVEHPFGAINGSGIFTASSPKRASNTPLPMWE